MRQRCLRFEEVVGLKETSVEFRPRKIDTFQLYLGWVKGDPKYLEKQVVCNMFKRRHFNLTKTTYVSSNSAFRSAYHRSRNNSQAAVFGSMENYLAVNVFSHDYRPGSFIGQPHIRPESMRDKLSSPTLNACNHRIRAANYNTQNSDLGIRTADPYHP
ncbi:MAG: hypothetical protein JRF17_01150 [Deltaproteobacteria bacterium]|jgi:hypothetical protein|nr:hypothetical protein [Deltaproteobacteria bacterium]